MAILGFPSTAIIGDLVWTGTNVSLAASNNVSISSNSSMSLSAAGPLASSFFSIGQYGIGFSTDDEVTLVTIGVNGAGIGMATDGPMNIGSTANVSVTATETLSLTGGNIISGGVSITTPQVLTLGGDASVDIESQQGVHLIAPSVDGVLGVNLGSGTAELFVDDGASHVKVIADSEGVEIKGVYFVNAVAPLFQHNGANVATQSFSIAMAIALG